MQRRNFIRVLGGAGTCAVFAPHLITGCTYPINSESPRRSGQGVNETDIRLNVASYGILAANPHNVQPWLVRLDAPGTFSLFVDPERLLPRTDPLYRQVHIGQGCFLENVKLAAKVFGYQANIEPFPEGQYGNQVLEDKPVARVHLRDRKPLESETLFDAMVRRQTNKREYDGRTVPLDERALLQRLAEHDQDDRLDHRFVWFDGERERARLTRFVGEAMSIEVSDRERHLETWRLFRFNQEEIEENRDGISYGSNGITGLRRWLVERLYSRESAKPVDSDWARFPVDNHYEIASSAPLFGCLVTRGNTRLDQVLAGRLYQRLNLAATQLGLAMHPHSQVLQEYPDMSRLQAQFKERFGFARRDTVQMLYRLGYARPVEKTPRRELDDLLVDQ